MTLTYRLTFALVVCVGISDALTANNRTPVFPKAPPPIVVQLAKHKHEPVFVQQIVKTIGVLSLGSILALNAGDASASAASMRKSIRPLSDVNDPRSWFVRLGLSSDIFFLLCFV
jgi:hypothetical protein